MHRLTLEDAQPQHFPFFPGELGRLLVREPPERVEQRPIGQLRPLEFGLSLECPLCRFLPGRLGRRVPHACHIDLHAPLFSVFLDARHGEHLMGNLWGGGAGESWRNVATPQTKNARNRCGSGVSGRIRVVSWRSGFGVLVPEIGVEPTTYASRKSGPTPTTQQLRPQAEP